MIPEGWKTVEQAAEISGYAPDEWRRWVRRIRRDDDYTDAGLKPGSKRAASMEYLLGSTPRIVKGSDIKRTHRGRIIIAASVVDAMKVARAKLQELKAQGARTIGEIAAEWGVSVREVRALARNARQREMREASRAAKTPPGD